MRRTSKRRKLSRDHESCTHVIKHILPYLDISTFMNFHIVNKYWQDLIRTNLSIVFFEKITSEAPEHSIIRTYGEIVSRKKENKQTIDYFKELKKLRRWLIELQVTIRRISTELLLRDLVTLILIIINDFAVVSIQNKGHYTVNITIYTTPECPKITSDSIIPGNIDSTKEYKVHKSGTCSVILTECLQHEWIIHRKRYMCQYDVLEKYVSRIQRCNNYVHMVLFRREFLDCISKESDSNFLDLVTNLSRYIAFENTDDIVHRISLAGLVPLNKGGIFSANETALHIVRSRMKSDARLLN